MTSMQPGDPRVAADVLAEEAAAAQTGTAPPGEDMTVSELRDLAGQRGVDLSGASTKPQILERLNAAGGSGSVSGSGSGSAAQDAESG